MGALQCRPSFFRNGNVPCCYFGNVPVDFEIVQCRLLKLRKKLCHVGNICSCVTRLLVALCVFRSLRIMNLEKEPGFVNV